MTQKTRNPQLNKPVVSGSALIADFMGNKLDGEYPNLWIIEQHLNQNNNHHFLEGNLKYKENWDWLMPVLEKLCRKEIGDGITYVKYATPRTFGMLSEDTGQIMVKLDGFQLFKADTLIEATYLAIVEVLQWLSQADL